MKTKTIAALGADLARIVWRDMMDNGQKKIRQVEAIFGIKIASRDEARQYLGEARYAAPAFAFHEDGRLHLLGVRDQPSQRAADMIANGHAWLFRKLATHQAPDIGQLKLPDFAHQIITDSNISASIAEALCLSLGKVHFSLEDGRTISIEQEEVEGTLQWKAISLDVSFSPKVTFNLDSVTISNLLPTSLRKSMLERPLKEYLDSPYRPDDLIDRVVSNKKSTTLFLKKSVSS